jgi:uncharacterized protein
MIIVVTGGVAAGKTALLDGLRAGIGAARVSETISDRETIHAAVVRDCAAGPAPHGELRRHEPGDIPGVDTRVGLFDAYYLAHAHDALIERMHRHLREGTAGTLLVEWATGPRVDFSRDPGWSGDDAWRWLDQTLDDLLGRLQREGLLPRVHLAWIDRAVDTRADGNAIRRDAVPLDDFGLLGPTGGGLHELTAAGLRLAASLAEGDRFTAIRNEGTRETLVEVGRSLGQGWAPPATSPVVGDGARETTGALRGWVAAARDFVRLDQGDDASGHDHHHSERVWFVARRLAADTPGADPDVVELAALLHDVDDWKRRPAGAAEGAKTAAWMQDAGVPQDLAARILEVIRQISFKSVDQARPDTIEGRLVQDADRLDALGAIGVARLFAFGGSRGRAIHDPAVPPALGMDAEAYRAHEGTSVNHIHEKILHLRDLLNTDAARALGDERHRYVEDFLARLMDEWEGRR